MSPPTPRGSTGSTPSHQPPHQHSHSSLVDFCETNYYRSAHIVEFWNTITGFAMFFIHLMFVQRVLLVLHQNSKPSLLKRYPRFLLTSGAFLVQSIGSGLLHATLQREYQMLDEVPMMICALGCVYALEAEAARTTSMKNTMLGLALAGVGCFMFYVYLVLEDFVVFHILFTPIEFYGLGRTAFLLRRVRGRLEAAFLEEADSAPPSGTKRNVDKEGQLFYKSKKRAYDYERFARCGLSLYVAAVAAWVLEMGLCDPRDTPVYSGVFKYLHVHAWAWHLLVAMGFNLLSCSLVVLALERDQVAMAALEGAPGERVRFVFPGGKDEEDEGKAPAGAFPKLGETGVFGRSLSLVWEICGTLMVRAETVSIGGKKGE